MLKFLKSFKDNSEVKEITYEEALDTLLTTYKDNDMTRDMLTIVNNIDCRFSWVFVHDVTDNGELCLIPGACNYIPDNFCYDDDGNRVE